MIINETIIPPENCEKAGKNNKITVNEDGYTHELITKLDESILQHRKVGASLEGDSSKYKILAGSLYHAQYSKADANQHH